MGSPISYDPLPRSEVRLAKQFEPRHQRLGKYIRRTEKAAEFEFNYRTVWVPIKSLKYHGCGEYSAPDWALKGK